MATDSVRSIVDIADQLPFHVLIVSVDRDPDRIIYANRSLLDLMECASLDELIEATHGSYHAMLSRAGWHDLPAGPHEPAVGEPADVGHRYYQLVSRSGRRHDVIDSRTLIDDAELGKAYAFYISAFDVAADTLIFDSTSGLHNRKYLIERYEGLGEGQGLGEGRGSLCVCYLQMLRFRDYNAAYGQEEGDILLHDLGMLVTETFQTDSCARLYADHFAVFYDGEDVEARCRELHDRALRLREDFAVHLNIGVYRPGDEQVSAATAIDRAKVACDETQRDEHVFLNLYSDALAERLRLDAYILENVDQAMQEGWLEVWYQPIMRAMTEEVSGFEALARWNDPAHGMIAPGRFIPVLESRGLASKVDSYVAEQACRAISAWVGAGHRGVPISVNLSRADFISSDPVSMIASCVRRHDVPADLLWIEVTETTAMQSPEVIAKAIDQFHEAGHKVLMDDFGSAYSSLNALGMFDFDELKIDTSFIQNFDDKAREVVTSIIGMAKELGIHTLAEGIETEEQATYLRSVGCEHIQGFYYGRPQPLAQLEEWVAVSHLRLEGPEERELYDLAGFAPISPSKMQALLFDDGTHLTPLYLSEPLERLLQSDYLSVTKADLERMANSPAAIFGARLRQTASQTAKSGEAKSFFTTFSSKRCKISVRTIANRGDDRILLADCKALTSAFGKDDGEEALLRGATFGFDCAYVIGPKASRVEVLFSCLEDEQPGDVITMSTIPSFDLVHPDDRRRFLYMSDLAHIEQAARRSKLGRFSTLIRFRNDAGKYDWWEYSFVGIGSASRPVFLVCSRRCSVVPEDLRLMAADVLGDGTGDAGRASRTPRLPWETGDVPFPYYETRVVRDAKGEPVDFVYLYANESYASRVNRVPDELLGRRYLDVFPQGSRQWPREMDNALAIGSLTHQLLYGEALESWSECYMMPMEGTDHVGVLIVTTDRQRGLTEQALFNGFNDVPLPCVVMRPATVSGRHDIEYLYANDSYCRLAGKGSYELLGHGYLELFESASSEWVELGERAAAGEHVHGRIWGPVQRHWMDVYASPSSIAGCCVMVSAPVDDDRRRLSMLASSHATDTAAIDIARDLIGPNGSESAMSSALFTLGKQLGVQSVYVLSHEDDGWKREFTYLNPRFAEMLGKRYPLESDSMPHDWLPLLEQGRIIVAGSIPAYVSRYLRHVELPEMDLPYKVDSLLVAPFVEGKELFGALVAVNSDFDQDIDVLALFETASFFLRSSLINDRMRLKADYDVLTSSRSREALKAAVGTIDEHTSGVGVVFADVDNLKETNDEHGHGAGDRLLMGVARMLRDIFGADDVYRLGGDEFVIFLGDVSEREFERYRDALSERLAAEKDMSVSTGFAWSPDGADIHGMIESADRKMYLDKRSHHEAKLG